MTGDAHLGHEFATEWPTYDLDEKTRSLLSYAQKLTETPGMVGKEDVTKLEGAGWSDKAIWEMTSLISFFNFSGRLEAASGLPPDKIPDGAKFSEGRHA